MTSSISTNNQVWFSNPEIEQEEEYAKGRSYRQSLNVINQLKEDGEDRKSKVGNHTSIQVQFHLKVEMVH